MYLPPILQNRVYLLTIIGFITTFAVIGPFFVGHTFSLHLIVHEILHIAAITFGVFLTILSVIAYNSTRNSNLIFTALAFTTFTLLSIFLLAEDLSGDLLEHESTGYEVVEVLLTLMIGLFAIGVFSNQKFPTRRTYD